MFCPASIYYHQIDQQTNELMGKSKQQIFGLAAHSTIDNNNYSSSSYVLQGITVYSSQYNLIGKIDIFNTKTGQLTERKNRIKYVYDGYIFQLYGQCFGLREAGFSVKSLCLHSLSDNRNYHIVLPESNSEMLKRFEQTLNSMNVFSFTSFKQDNVQKCSMCIYKYLCPFDISEQ